MNSFNQFKLVPTLLESIKKLGFTEPTEIQSKTIPALLENKDVIGQSRTGSGKTAAYLLPLFQSVMQSDRMALVMVPTRELALQVEEFAKKILSKSVQVRISVVIGGGSMRHQQRTLSQRPNLIIATPGRLIDHLSRGHGQQTLLSKVSMVVLDEADRMLDMGFYPQITRVLQKVPRERQTTLFSATFSPQIKKLAREIMKDPVEISAGTQNAPTTIEQKVIEVSDRDKYDVLVNALNERQGSVLVFSRTKHRTDRLGKFLISYGFKVGRIHGDRTLAQRKGAIHELKTGVTRILVATDIAARGLDIAQVEHVINFDLPMNPEDYLHRIGRTGRAGASGQALSLVTSGEKGKWREIVRFSGASPTLVKAPVAMPGAPVVPKPEFRPEFRNEGRQGRSFPRPEFRPSDRRDFRTDGQQQPQGQWKPRPKFGARFGADPQVSRGPSPVRAPFQPKPNGFSQPEFRRQDDRARPMVPRFSVKQKKREQPGGGPKFDKGTFFS